MPEPKRLSQRILGAALLALAAAAPLAFRTTVGRPAPAPVTGLQGVVRPVSLQIPADAFEGATGWINTAGPIKFSELKGKIVLLDFWTYCCINCHHVLPDLAKLEEKYKNELVVIGVHSPKFSAEQGTENIRQKVREYQIKHPVISDANQVIWNRFGVNSWPTLVLIGPDGQPVGAVSGEGHYALLDRVIGEVVLKARAGKTLNETPVHFFPETEKPDNTPLLYPGKVLADAAGKRLFVSDTGHNRIVVADLEGKNPEVIGDGVTGLVDGPFAKAQFNRPQGIALVGDVLYVADTENHAVRAVDLKAKTVTTVAGTGEQSKRDPRVRLVGPAKSSALNSPWDIVGSPDGRSLFVAMAGPHQIWRIDLKASEILVFAGTGRENITDGIADAADFSQPSGLATDGKELFVADSEVSALRAIDLKMPHTVRSIVGLGLFKFGDVDGRAETVRLQHCLGVAYADGKLYVADTYNNKVKVCDPHTRAVESVVGGDPSVLYQPGGLSVAGKTLYVADTNNARIRKVDLATKAVSDVEIAGLTPPTPPRRKPVFLNATKATLAMASVRPGSEVVIDVSLPLASDLKLNAESPLPYLVESKGKAGIVAESAAFGGRVEPPSASFQIKTPLEAPSKAGDQFELKVSVSSFVCSKGSNVCFIKSFVWTVPVEVKADGLDSIKITR